MTRNPAADPAKRAPHPQRGEQGEAEKRPAAKKSGRNSDYSPQFWDRTRELWETTAKLSPAKAAAQACKEFGIESPPHHSTIAERKAREGWEKGAAQQADKPATEPEGEPEPASQEAADPHPAEEPSNNPATAPALASAQAPSAEDPFKDLTPKQALFVDEYLIDLNGTQAYMRAFKTDKVNSASVQASTLLGNHKVQSALAHRMEERRRRLEIDQDAVLKGYLDRYTADPRELVEFRRVSCPYCHGPGFKKQFTPAGLEREQEAHARKWAKATADGRAVPDFDEKGGLGYDQRKPPHPDCPECHGFGEEKQLIQDTRNLSERALSLYGGVEMTKDGLKIKMASREEALTNLARHTGFFEKDNEQAALVAVAPEVLDEIYAAKRKAALEGAEKVRGRVKRLGIDKADHEAR